MVHSRPMDIKELRHALSDPRVNLTQIAKASGVNLRTVHRIKSGKTKVVLTSTLGNLEKALAQHATR